MKATWSSEMSVDFQWTSQCYGPEYGTLPNICCESLKSYNITVFWTVGGMRTSDSPFWRALSLLDANLILPVHTPCNAVKCPNYILIWACTVMATTASCPIPHLVQYKLVGTVPVRRGKLNRGEVASVSVAHVASSQWRVAEVHLIVFPCLSLCLSEFSWNLTYFGMFNYIGPTRDSAYISNAGCSVFVAANNIFNKSCRPVENILFPPH
jgi:hypothetical protein